MNLGNTVAELKKKAVVIRENILETIGVGKKGHVGGSMSSADLVTALYFYKMNHDANNPEDPDRDRFIFSKGHSVLAQYAALAETGYFSKDELKKTKTFGSILQGHPEKDTPGIEANTGSLGQGLSLGLGMALGGKLDKRAYNVYVIVGDGELAEGQIWEAIIAANNFKVDNLVAIVDSNKVQATGPIAERYDLGDIKAKFEASGWETFEIDGHNMEEIVEALDATDNVKGRPSVIIANTVKGKGVSFAENKASYHNAKLTEEQYRQAKEDIANL
ncbi:transketolase [Iocasia frigidifontis]|uniref:Transketolase n=1 Tax=Iocasia fonsfrigidae TaxID=2682810 RepID=A0A8A7KGM2_9FIRM|nr:transketolase [Iocasia fonsfrigidae]